LSKCRPIIDMIINSVIAASFQSECELGLVRVLEGEQKVVVSDVMTPIITIRPFHTIVATENIAVF